MQGVYFGGRLVSNGFSHTCMHFIAAMMSSEGTLTSLHWY